MHVKIIGAVCIAGLPLPTSCRPRGPRRVGVRVRVRYRVRYGVGLVWADAQGEIDPTRRFVATCT